MLGRVRAAALAVWVCAAVVARADPLQAVQQLRQLYPGVGTYSEFGGQTTRVWAAPFGFGASPEITADGFVQRHSAIWDVPAVDLIPGDVLSGEYATGVLYQPATESYKFTMVVYHQSRDGVPVYGADLRLLVRNLPGHPLVLAASSLKPLGAFQVSPTLAVRLAENAAQAAALARQPSYTEFSVAQLVIWAGADEKAAPVLALVFEARNRGSPTATEPLARRYVADAATGAILYETDLICQTDISGNVSALATTLPAAMQCNPEVPMQIPYALVSVSGGSSTYADASGNFTLSNSGTAPVTVGSPLSGRYFAIANYGAGGADLLSLAVTPPGPANFVHNSANGSDSVRALANAYVECNRVRDWVLSYKPDYPHVSTDLGFPVYVNRADGYCPGNAWYDPTGTGSLNLCAGNTTYANTAFSSVIHHEYGHHICQYGGNGSQGAFGEGAGDSVAVLLADDPRLGAGFYMSDCTNGIRNADNTLQYPCTSDIHTCAQLMSGCIWSTRNALQPNHSDYIATLSNLLLGAVQLHQTASVTPQLTIDFLTLDDNDGNIYNGTPHSDEICAGFGAHNMTCPEMQTGLLVSPVGAFSAWGPPGGPFSPPSLSYTLQNVGSNPLDYQVVASQSWVSIGNAVGTLADGGAVLVTISVNVNANALAVGDYGDAVSFTNTTTHRGDTTRAVSLAVTALQPIYYWNMDTNPGWITTGLWAWGMPTGEYGDHGGPDPTSGYTGANIYGYNLSGGYADYLPARNLTTPGLDCSGLTGVHLRFRRWLGVEGNAYDHAYVRVSTNGTTFANIWSNPTETLDDQGWILQEYDISTYADNQPTVYIRWTMGTTDGGWTYCGWNIDDVGIWAHPLCTAPAISAQPQSQSSCTGDPVMFSVAVGGTPPLAFQWRKNGDNVAGATSSLWAIASVAPGDAALYDCVVTNTCGSVMSNAATLTVNATPSIDTHPLDQNVCAGDLVTFEIVAAGAPAPAYQWRRGGTTIAGATQSSYAIASAGLDDAGSYDCVVTNLCGTVTSHAGALTVDSGPSIRMSPLNQTVPTGNSATFGVASGGTLPLGYQWRKDGNDIGGATSGEYTIPAVTSGDAGSYDCVVSNACGTETSDAAVLTVNPTLCRGDCDCDGHVGFSDIDYFIAAVPDGEAPWTEVYRARHGGADPPCTFANCDVNGDGHVGFADIDPFVSSMPSACP